MLIVSNSPSLSGTGRTSAQSAGMHHDQVSSAVAANERRPTACPGRVIKIKLVILQRYFQWYPHLELVQWVQWINTGHSAVLQTQQRRSIIAGSIPRWLTDQNKIRPEIACNSCSSSNYCHRNRNSLVSIRRDGDLPELCLFHTDVIVSVKSFAAEVLRPVRVLIVQNEQSETTVLVECRTSCRGDCGHCVANNRSSLIAGCTGQTLHTLQQTLPGLCGTRWGTYATRRSFSESQRVGCCAGRTRRCRRWNVEPKCELIEHFMERLNDYPVAEACLEVLIRALAAVAEASPRTHPPPVRHHRTRPINLPSWTWKGMYGI